MLKSLNPSRFSLTELEPISIDKKENQELGTESMKSFHHYLVEMGELARNVIDKYVDLETERSQILETLAKIGVNKPHRLRKYREASVRGMTTHQAFRLDDPHNKKVKKEENGQPVFLNHVGIPFVITLSNEKTSKSYPYYDLTITPGTSPDWEIKSLSQRQVPLVDTLDATAEIEDIAEEIYDAIEAYFADENGHPWTPPPESNLPNKLILSLLDLYEHNYFDTSPPDLRAPNLAWVKYYEVPVIFRTMDGPKKISLKCVARFEVDNTGGRDPEGTTEMGDAIYSTKRYYHIDVRYELNENAASIGRKLGDEELAKEFMKAYHSRVRSRGTKIGGTVVQGTKGNVIHVDIEIPFNAKHAINKTPIMHTAMNTIKLAFDSGDSTAGTGGFPQAKDDRQRNKSGEIRSQYGYWHAGRDPGVLQISHSLFNALAELASQGEDSSGKRVAKISAIPHYRRISAAEKEELHQRFRAQQEKERKAVEAAETKKAKKTPASKVKPITKDKPVPKGKKN